MKHLTEQISITLTDLAFDFSARYFSVTAITEKGKDLLWEAMDRLSYEDSVCADFIECDFSMGSHEMYQSLFYWLHFVMQHEPTFQAQFVKLFTWTTEEED
jgi:hypothetical protein